MNDKLDLTLTNQMSGVAQLQAEMEAFARQHALPAAVLHAVQLALEEHLTNILSHGYDDLREHQIRVQIRLQASVLRIEVEDDGHAFNPLERPTPDLSKPIEERPVGGLGIHMMRQSLDDLAYLRENGKNILVMIKRFGAA